MAGADLSRRSREPELMDTEAVGFEDFRHCLRHLCAINRLTLAYRPTLAWLDRLVRRHRPDRPITILDAGSGYGDTLRRIARWAGARGIPVDLVGVDVNPWAARAATEATPPGLPIRYRTADLFALGDDEPVDVVISALFAHHLDDATLRRFLRWMDGRARLGWFVNDLHRHGLPYRVVRAAVRLPGVDRMVVHDAPVSVARAFTRADWTRALAEAGLPAESVTVEWFLPFRYGVGRIR